MSIINKIWLYGGWFYITLFLFLAVRFYFPQVKSYAGKILLIIAVLAAIFSATKEIVSRTGDFNNFLTSPEIKLDKDTLGQFGFAQEVKKVLPAGSIGCVYFSWDTPTAYLIQELYPYRFKPIADDYDVRNCGYVISQFEPRNKLNGSLILEYKKTYLYKLAK